MEHARSWRMSRTARRCTVQVRMCRWNQPPIRTLWWPVCTYVRRSARSAPVCPHAVHTKCGAIRKRRLQLSAPAVPIKLCTSRCLAQPHFDSASTSVQDANAIAAKDLPTPQAGIG